MKINEKNDYHFKRAYGESREDLIQEVDKSTS
jgi:hypothetical protein